MWSGPGRAIVQFRSKEVERHDRGHECHEIKQWGRDKRGEIKRGEIDREGLVFIVFMRCNRRTVVLDHDCSSRDRVSPNLLQLEIWHEHQPGDNRIPNSDEYGRGSARPSPMAGGVGRKRSRLGTS